MAKQKQKYSRYSRRIERNLMCAYARAMQWDREHGLTWYQTAHNIALGLTVRYQITIEQACGVIAALSPGLQWELNVSQATDLIDSWHSGARGAHLPRVGTYGRKNVRKCTDILSGKDPSAVLGGFKVHNFYANILDPKDVNAVTIDRHAKCCAYGKVSTENSLVRNSEYEYIAEHFRACAHKLGLTPNQFQATVWVVWRRLQGNLNQEDLFETVPILR